MNMVVNKRLSFGKELENFCDLVESQYMIINKFHTFLSLLLILIMKILHLRSTSLSLPRSNSKDQTLTLLCKKKLTSDDLHTGNLKVPAGVFVAKRRRDRMMVVPFLDNKGAVWEMQASYHGLALNWYKFVKEHGLQPNDVIFFYDDDSISEHYIIHYEKSGEGHSESR